MKMIECPKCGGKGRLPDWREYGPRMRQLRLASDMGQRQVAKVMGISPMYLSDMETGRRAFTPKMQRKFTQAIQQPITQDK